VIGHVRAESEKNSGVSDVGIDLAVVIDEIDRHRRKLGAQAIVVLHPNFFREGEQNQQPGHGG
jgi:hypothetical protein